MSIRQLWMITNLETDTLVSGRGLNGGHKIKRGEGPEEVFLSEREAMQACEIIASQNPMTTYAVMGIIAIRETAKPTVINKRFTEEGELILE